MPGGAGTRDSMSKSARFPPRSPQALDGRGGEDRRPTLPFLEHLPCLAPFLAPRCFLERNRAWNGSKNHASLHVCKKVDYQYIDLLLIYIDSLFSRLPPSAKARSAHPMG